MNSRGKKPKTPDVPVHQQAEWYRVTLASIGDAVITTDTEGGITFLNAVAESLTGWTLEEAAGQSLDRVFRIINEESRKTVESPTVQALREGVIIGLVNHTLLIAKDGTERPIDDSAGPIRNEQGEVVGVVLVFRDITERRQAERSLRESEARYQTLFAAAPMAVFVCDRNAVIQHYNARAVELWGREPTCGVEKHCGSTKLWLPDGTFLPHDQSPMLEVLRTGAPVLNVEVFIERPNGSRLPVLVNFAALKNAAGEIIGAITSFTDITERKRDEEVLRESETRKSAMLNSALDGIITIDHQGTIIEFNPAAARMFGYRTEDVLGRELADLIIPPALREGHRLGLARYLETGEGPILDQRLELTAVHSNGGQFPVEVAITRINKDGLPLFTGYISDQTDRKRAEEALRQAVSKLSEANRRKDEFLAMLSHELRNPLAAVSNAVQVLGLQKHEDQFHQQARTMIERQVTQLTHLVDDLLDISRITSGKLQLRPERLAVNDIMQHAVETARPLIEKRRHELTLSLSPRPIWLYADSTRLEQVVVNLLTNAAKYADEGAHIWLSTEQEADACMLRVRDTGIGISLELLPHIFDLFTQAERSLDRSLGGMGIGLALVKQIIELHGGTIAASSVLGQGSEFVVRLPVAGD